VAVHLEDGETVTGTKYEIRDTALIIDSLPIPLSKVLLLKNHSQHYFFLVGSSDPKKSAVQDVHSVCDRATLFAMRYAETLTSHYVDLDPLVQVADSSEWRNCFSQELERLGVNAYEVSDPAAVYDNKRIRYDSTMIVMRNGDTTTVSGPMYLRKGMLRYVRSGVTVRQREVLMLLTPDGQKVIHASSGKLVLLKPQVSRLEPCSYGLIYARMYWDVVEHVTQIEGLEKELAKHPDFTECFYGKQVRMLNGKQAIKISRKVLGVSNGASNGLNQ